jgi:hypothetical protein
MYKDKCLFSVEKKTCLIWAIGIQSFHLQERTGSEEDLIISDDTSHVPLSDNQYVIDTAVGKRSSHDSHIDTRGKELWETV